jgi:hypothetical protein
LEAIRLRQKKQFKRKLRKKAGESRKPRDQGERGTDKFDVAAASWCPKDRFTVFIA